MLRHWIKNQGVQPTDILLLTSRRPFEGESPIFKPDRVLGGCTLYPAEDEAPTTTNAICCTSFHKSKGLDAQAAVVIYSLASSSKDYIANQIEWLLSANRWNVAISRAKACAIIVGDIDAHLTAIPKSLNGITTQAKIRKLLEDEGWAEKEPKQFST
ncbi:MAG: hypothetical protein ACK5NG_12130 [Chthoniobacterales bacterium]